MIKKLALFIIGLFLLSSFALAANFGVGDPVVVQNVGSLGLNVRDQPTTSGTALFKKFDGNQGSVLSGPTSANGYTWWKIRWSDGQEGYSADGDATGAWLTKMFVSPSTKFSVGNTVQVSGTGGSNLNVRNSPPDLAFLGSVGSSAQGSVAAGPFYGIPKGSSGFYHFWQVNFGSVNGWAAEDFLTKIQMATVPSAPQSLSAIGNDGFVQLYWSAPSTDGGSPLIKYRLYKGTSSSSQSFYTETSLGQFKDTAVTNGITYYYKVSAVNAIGEGAATSVVSATPISSTPTTTVPSAPTNLVVSGGTNSVALSWNVPSNNGGASITSYRVYRGTSSGGESLFTTTSSNSYIDGSVSPGTTYYYKVSAVNSVGESSLSGEAQVTISGGSGGTTAPGAPTNLIVTGGAIQIDLSWNAPSNNGGSAITHYEIHRGTTSGGETLYFTTASAGTTFQNTANVVSGTTYYYKVKAVNVIGASGFSNEASASLQATPPPTTGMTPELLAAVVTTLVKEVGGSFLPVEEGGDYGMGPGCTYKISGSCRSTPYDGGVDYKGRGYIQITHKYNYLAHCGADCIGTSTLELDVCGCKNQFHCTVTDSATCPMVKALQPGHAARIFASFYRTHDLITLANAQDYATLGIRIQGSSAYGTDFKSKADTYLALFQQNSAKTNTLIQCLLSGGNGCGPGVFPELFVYTTEKNSNLYNALKSITAELSGTTPTGPIAVVQLSSNQVRSGDLVFFDASGSTRNLVSYEWDFGDGQPKATGKTVSHRFRGAQNQARDYVVKLTVTDDQGRKASTSFSITVKHLIKTIELQIEGNELSPGMGGKTFATILYNWWNEDEYIVSKVIHEALSYSGLATLTIWSFEQAIPLPAWSKNDWVFSGGIESFNLDQETHMQWGDTFVGLGVDAFDVFQVIVEGWAGAYFSFGPEVPLPSITYEAVAFQPDATEVQVVPVEVPDLYVAKVFSPAELRVYDQEGHVTGLVNGEVVQDIPNSAYDLVSEMVLSLTEPTHYEIVGTDSGTFGFVSASTDEQDTAFIAENIPIQEEETITFTLDQDILSAGGNGVTTQVDQESDGTVDATFNTSNNLTAEEFIHEVRQDTCVVTFRTSSSDGTYSKNDWIALDVGADGTLEGFEFQNKNAANDFCTEKKSSFIGKTLEGYSIWKHNQGSGDLISVCAPADEKNRMLFHQKKFTEAVTDTKMVEGYEEREVVLCPELPEVTTEMNEPSAEEKGWMFEIEEDSSMENSAEENKLIALKLGESPKEKLTGNRTIRIKSDKKLVVEFPFDFTENTINTSNISIELRTTGKGGASVKGIQLGDERKILHFPQLTDSNKICILDAEATLDEITTDCIGEHEYMITCDGSTSEQGYTCEITDKIFIVQGLKHSAVSEFSGAPSGASAASSSASMGGYGGGGSAGTPGEWFRGIVKRTFDEKQTSEEEVKPLQTLAPKMFNQPVVQEEKVLSPEREPVLEEQPTSVLSPVQIVPEKPVAVQHYSWLKWTLLPFAFALIGALLLVKKRRNTVSP